MISLNSRKIKERVGKANRWWILERRKIVTNQCKLKGGTSSDASHCLHLGRTRRHGCSMALRELAIERGGTA